MKANLSLGSKLIPLAVMVIMAYAITPIHANEPSVVVEEIDLKQRSNAEQAEELWDQTKIKTGEAASAAAEYSKVQGTRALEATKHGIAKGADVVGTQSKKAWEATKETSEKVVDYTTEKAIQAGAAIGDALSSEEVNKPVIDRSTDSTLTN